MLFWFRAQPAFRGRRRRLGDPYPPHAPAFASPPWNFDNRPDVFSSTRRMRVREDSLPAHLGPRHRVCLPLHRLPNLDGCELRSLDVRRARRNQATPRRTPAARIRPPRRTETARVCMCRMRCVDLGRKSQSSRAAESPARNPRRHVMVPAGWPHLDTKRAALGHDPARFSSVRKAGGRLTRSRSSLEISSGRTQSLGARLIGPPALGALLALLGQLLELLFLRRELGLIFLSGALLVLTLRHGSSIPRVAIPSTQSDSSRRGTAGSNRRVVPSGVDPMPQRPSTATRRFEALGPGGNAWLKSVNMFPPPRQPESSPA